MADFAPNFITTTELRKMGFKAVGENVMIADNCTIFGNNNIEIGDNVRIDGYTTIIANGEGFLRLGSNIHIGGYSLIIAGCGVIMEDFSGISQGVRIYSRSDDYSGEYMTNPTVPSKFTNVQDGLVKLGRHCIVGSGTVILPGAQLGEGSAVGALSLVTKNIPAWEIYSGTPAKRIKARKKGVLDLEKQFLAGE